MSQYLTSSFSVPVATYLPEDGPQTNISTKDVTDGNWEECHRQNMNIELTDNLIDTTIQESCFKPNVMMGCGKIEKWEDGIIGGELEVLAWAPRDSVFVTDKDDKDVVGCGDDGLSEEYRYCDSSHNACFWDGNQTDRCTETQCQRGHCDIDVGCKEGFLTNEVCGINCYEKTVYFYGKAYIAKDCQDYSAPNCLSCTCNGGTCSGSETNGVTWYRTFGVAGTWGFANAGSQINLHWVDVASGDDAKRLSMHVNENKEGWVGGHRCGSTKASFNTGSGNGFDNKDPGEWQLVFYHANTADSE